MEGEPGSQNKTKGPFHLYLKWAFLTCPLMPSSPRYDFIEIRDGDSESADLLGKHCGNIAPPTIISSGSVLYIKFTSDYARQGAGFSLRYEIFKTGQCGRGWKARSGASTRRWNTAICVWPWGTVYGSCVMFCAHRQVDGGRSSSRRNWRQPKMKIQLKLSSNLRGWAAGLVLGAAWWADKHCLWHW